MKARVAVNGHPEEREEGSVDAYFPAPALGEGEDADAETVE